MGNEGFAPHPNAFGFGVGGGSNCEPLLRVEDDFVEQKGLARTINACDRNYGNFSLEGVEEVEGFRVDLVFWS